jgi:hypothetical protein
VGIPYSALPGVARGRAGQTQYESLDNDITYDIILGRFIMASGDKILEAWRKFIPPEVPLDDVLLVVKAKFEQVLPPQGSHYRIYDSRLERFTNLFPDHPRACLEGTFHIPTLKGRKVKGFYVKDILGFLEIAEFMTQKGK